MKPNLYVYCMYLQEQKKLQKLQEQKKLQKLQEQSSRQTLMQDYGKNFNSFMYSLNSFTMYD